MSYREIIQDKIIKELVDEIAAKVVEKVSQIIESKEPPVYIKSAQVRKMLGGISDATLQQARINGDIPHLQLDSGTWLYPYKGVKEALEAKTKGVTGGVS
ncbi:MAG: hypothetical protein ACERKD_12075 [Prolixibacteraceae bacterium]